jgi:casein kinase II subunit beta
MSEELRTSRVKVFCPRCEEVYIPKKKCPDVDGAYFGCSFPSIFLMVSPPTLTHQNTPDITVMPNNQTYVPRVFGFRLYKKKGSRFQDQQNKVNEITHYSEE